MTDTAVNLSDTSTWLPLDGLAPGFDANKAPHSLELAGREITTVDARGSRVVHRFSEQTVTWHSESADGDPSPARTQTGTQTGAQAGSQAGAQTDTYEAFKVDDELYFVQFHHESLPDEAVSLVLDLRTGRALSVRSVILAEAERAPGQTRVQHVFATARLEGVGESVEASGTAPAPTNALIGRRVRWTYSEQHAYEHIYLSPQWYTWQCLAGPEKGLADTDENSAWEIRPGIYVFAWREKVIPCASVTIADHRTATAIRSYGVLFGLDETGTVPTHFTFGAHGQLISMTVHPG